tara:strand:- start:229 stop:468 length:240 start_codon:yes stop_codon:yes gene_type:complete
MLGSSVKDFVYQVRRRSLAFLPGQYAEGASSISVLLAGIRDDRELNAIVSAGAQVLVWRRAKITDWNAGTSKMVKQDTG